MEIKKKPTKKEIEEIKLKIHKDKMTHKKRVYETYLKALVKYNIKSLAYGSIMYEDLWREDLLKTNQKSFMEMCFGKPGLTEEEQQKEQLEHYDTLIKMAESKIESLNENTKIKIAKDCINFKWMWLRTGLNNFEEKSKKEKTKRIKNETNKKERKQSKSKTSSNRSNQGRVQKNPRYSKR